MDATVTNPYSQISAPTSSTGQTAAYVPDASSVASLTNAQNALSSAQNIDYPATQNSANLGTPVNNTVPSQTNSSSTQSASGANTDSSSRGFNPWSLVGEANSR